MMTDTSTHATHPPQPKAETEVGYYVSINPQTQDIICWYPQLYGTPSASNLVKVTQEDYQTWVNNPAPQKINKDGSIGPSSSPINTLPIKDQASQAMQNVQQQASMAAAMGETFGPQMRDYVKQLRAIADGSDTSTATLPTAPNAPTV